MDSPILCPHYHSDGRLPRSLLETLARYLSQKHPGPVILIRYLDDVLPASISHDVLEYNTTELAREMQEGGWIVAPKSVFKPFTRVTWLGKRIDGCTFSCRRPILTLPKL